ncbi:FtsX-like permease family protein [Nocardioides panaciterrulae]|uniref:Putative ABC transport system permease protein n=1 Tax=Nocardioides panaciterrulae TaxID=661492 RepID=A0A7Y9E7N3_9ACTN|nr:ABC transporter permease [Nocardioides panaciterrulae]NYD42633.1 putative ABC transport system permease protein [Nocardioides panaciterrulae]
MIHLWLAGLLRRSPARLLAAAAGIAIAVALVAGLGSFLVTSQATMTTRAAAQVAVDWQVKVAAHRDPAAVLKAVTAAPGTLKALPVGFADSPGLRATTDGTTQETGAAKVLGLPAGYVDTFPLSIRLLTGSLDGPLVAQQTAANLHVAPGDRIEVKRAGSAPYSVHVAGIVELPQADSLFQDVGAPSQSQPVAPPDNVVLLPAPQFANHYHALSRTRPDLVSTQIHVKRDHAALASDPSSAFVAETGAANNLSVRTSGAAIVGNNLGASLDAAREDASYSRILFLFLGAPGALLAGALTAAITQAGAERRRKEQALLRARGSSPTQLLRLVLVEAAVVGVLGALIGLGVAAAIGAATSWPWDLAAALTGLLIAGLVVAIPAARDLRSLAANQGHRQQHRTRPIWLRFGLDLALIALGLAVFWAAGRNKYTLVLAPEGVPTISVSYWAFLAPALAWLGGALLCWRIADTLLVRGRAVVALAATPFLGPLARAVSGMLMRQRRLVARSAVLVALALAFAISTATFNVTYQVQAEVDAQLTNGADVTVTESPGADARPADATKLSSIPGVTAVSPLQHRFAYVGNDLQDLYGIDPAMLTRATTLQDAYFQGATAAESLKRLASRPDAVLVSAETVNDFQLNLGDLIKLRLQDAHTHTYQSVTFHYVGIVNEFPTAPKDSFLVANADYVAQQTGSAAVGTFLVNTNGHDVSAVADRVRAVVGTTGRVGTIRDARGLVGSSLTSVDLGHLTRLELSFALVIAAAAGGLVIGLGLAERRRAIAVATSLGATRRQVRRFGFAEPAFVLVIGTLCGLGSGWGLSYLLVKVLTGVFDPPPTALTVPWLYLSTLVVCTIGAVSVVSVLVIERARRQAPDLLRAI